MSRLRSGPGFRGGGSLKHLPSPPQWRFSGVGAESLRVRLHGGFVDPSRLALHRGCGCRSRVGRRATLENVAIVMGLHELLPSICWPSRHSPKVAAEHYLMSREHHFEDVVNGCAPDANRSGEGQGSPPECDAKCASIATRNVTPQASASGSTESHKTTEPAATIQVAAGSSGIATVTKTCPRQDAAQKNSRQGPWMALPA